MKETKKEETKKEETQKVEDPKKAGYKVKVKNGRPRLIKTFVHPWEKQSNATLAWYLGGWPKLDPPRKDLFEVAKKEWLRRHTRPLDPKEWSAWALRADAKVRGTEPVRDIPFEPVSAPPIDAPLETPPGAAMGMPAELVREIQESPMVTAEEEIRRSHGPSDTDS